MEKFTVDLDAVLDEFEFHEGQVCTFFLDIAAYSVDLARMSSFTVLDLH